MTDQEGRLRASLGGPSSLVYVEAVSFSDFVLFAQHYLVTTSGKSWQSRADSLYDSVTNSRDGYLTRDMDPPTRVSTYVLRPSMIQLPLRRSKHSILPDQTP